MAGESAAEAARRVDCIEGDRLRLVKYGKEHVALYNEWMKDPFLQETTCSEPLSLDDEYALQADWERDDAKWIFLMEDKASGKPVGDVDLFLHDYLAAGEAELLVMVADADSRRKGFGSEAVRLMMGFARQHFNIRRFIVKITRANAPSIAMFQRLGFQQFDYVEAFDEVSLDLTVD